MARHGPLAITKRQAIRENLKRRREPEPKRLSHADWLAGGKTEPLPVSLGKVLSRGNRVAGELHRWLQHNGNKRNARLSLSIEDTIRLHTIRIWAQRHYIDTKEVLELILPIILSRSHRHGASGIGVSVRALTGEAASRILTEELAKRYPNDEHIGMWREAQRRRILNREQEHHLAARTVSEMATLEDFLDRYRERMHKTQQQATKNTTTPQRNYRWNPWA